MEVLDTNRRQRLLDAHRSGSLSATPRSYFGRSPRYLVANGIVIPISGWLANRIGRRTCSCSHRRFHNRLLALWHCTQHGPAGTFRAIQGACGGSLQPMSQAVMLEAFLPKNTEKRWPSGAIGRYCGARAGTRSGRLANRQLLLRWVFTSTCR